MGQRILLQIDQGGVALPPEVRQTLRRLGAADVRRSHAELPGLYTAVMPTTESARQAVAELKRVPGVRDAALDELSTTLDG